MPAARVATPPDGGSTRPRDIEQPHGPGITCARLCQHIPSRVKEGGASAGKQGVAQGVPAALPCGCWHGYMLLLVAPNRVLPKHALSLASTETQARTSQTHRQHEVRSALFVGAWDEVISREDAAGLCHQSLSWGLLGPT